MFKKLLPILFLFAGFQANAALIQFQYDDTISYSSITGLVAGQSATITVGLDNGVAGDVSQTWTAGDLTSVTFDFNNGGLVTTFDSPWGGHLGSGAGNFTTNGSGTLTGVMSSWWDFGVGSDYTSSGIPVTPVGWSLNGHNGVFSADGRGSVSLTKVSGLISAANWNKVAAVPEPSIIALFGLGLVGIGFARRRRQS
jgi:hypothetical protein